MRILVLESNLNHSVMFSVVLNYQTQKQNKAIENILKSARFNFEVITSTSKLN